MNTIDESRRQWGKVFDTFWNARERADTAWYQVENKQAFKDEEIRRLQGLIRDAQKALANWETKSV